MTAVIEFCRPDLVPFVVASKLHDEDWHKRDAIAIQAAQDEYDDGVAELFQYRSLRRTFLVKYPRPKAANRRIWFSRDEERASRGFLNQHGRAH